MSLDIKTLAVAKKNIRESLEGAGAIKGQKGDPGKDAPTISSIDIDENNVLSTTLSDGTILSGGTVKTVAGMNGVDGVDGVNGITPHIDSITKHWFIGDNDTGIVAEGKDGTDGVQGVKGEAGEQGIQGIQGVKGDKGDKGDTGKQGIQGIQGVQGIKGDKGDDGYPFLIYKEYSDISEFSANDFPKIGLMFMIKAKDVTDFPVYRYTGEANNPYSFITNLSSSESIKGDKGEKGEQGAQGVQGEKGDKGDKGDPGQQGIQGEQGIQGINGKDGITYQPIIGEVIEGNKVDVSIVVNDLKKTAAFNFVLKKGKDGIGSCEISTFIIPTTEWIQNEKNVYYSFETLYPFAEYDIIVEPNGESLTDEQLSAWIEAKIVGSPLQNRIIIMGSTPKVDIPVMIKASRKVSDA